MAKIEYIEYDKTCLIPPSTSISNGITTIPNSHHNYCMHDEASIVGFIKANLGQLPETLNYNTKEKERAKMVEIIWPKVKKVEILKENMVVRVTIDNSSYKQIRKYGDTFDLRVAVAIALVKNMWGNLTPEGNEHYARHFLLYHKDFSKVVDKAIKAYEKEKREKELEERRKEEIKKIKERRRAKNAMKRKKKKEAAASKE